MLVDPIREPQSLKDASHDKDLNQLGAQFIAKYAGHLGPGNKMLDVGAFADRETWPGKETKACWEENMKSLGLLEDITLYHKNSLAVADAYLDEFFDIVYIDASHIYPDVVADINAWWPKVKKGGYICGHDCELLLKPEYVDTIINHPLWDTDDMILVEGLPVNVIHAGVVVATMEIFGDKLQQRNHTWWVQK